MPVLPPIDRAYINCGLIAPEILYDIARVEAGQPAGPGFVHSLGSLIEACVLHERLYVVPQQSSVGSGWRGYGAIGQAIAASDFLKTLIDEKVLVNLVPEWGAGGDPPPSVSQLVDQVIGEAGLVEGYNYINFMTQTQLSGVTFAFTSPEIESLRNASDLLSIPGVFTVLESPFERPLETPEPGEIEAMNLALSRDFNLKDMQVVAGLNRRARAIEDLAYAMNMALITNFISLPHFLSTLDHKIKKSHELLNQINEKLRLDDDLLAEQPGVRPIPTAPLVRLALQTARGDPRALPEAILSLRKRHKAFRQALTDYEEAWFKAKSIRDRRELRNRFDQAWQELVTRLDRPYINWLYTVYDVLKKPLEAHVAIGDVAKGESIERSIINRVKGLRSFWNDLDKAPLSRETQALLLKTYPLDRDQTLWRYYGQISGELNNRLGAMRA